MIFVSQSRSVPWRWVSVFLTFASTAAGHGSADRRPQWEGRDSSSTLCPEKGTEMMKMMMTMMMMILIASYS